MPTPHERKESTIAGALLPPCRASQIHADNEKLQSEVAGALRNLAGEKEDDKTKGKAAAGATSARPASPGRAGARPATARSPAKKGGGGAIFGGLSRRSPGRSRKDK